MKKLLAIYIIFIFGLLDCTTPRLSTCLSNPVCCNVDSILNSSLCPIFNKLDRHNFNYKNCDFVYDIYIFPTNDEKICSNIYMLPVTTYKNYFENWNSFTGMVSCYIINSEGKYIAKAASSYLLTSCEKSNAAYEIEKSLITFCKKNKYIAYASVVCDYSLIYIGYNNEQIDIYRIIDNKLVFEKSMKVLK